VMALRKSTLALVLMLLTIGVGKDLAQSLPVPPPTTPPTQPTPDDGGGSSPDPTGNGGNCLVAIH
jgi:hypothetical protein